MTFKPAIYLLSAALLSPTVMAETRKINSEFQPAINGEATAWLLDWPVPANGKFTLRYLNNQPYIQATFKNPHATDLLASDNMTGNYQIFYPDGKLKKQGEWNQEGDSVGMETRWRESGKPEEVRRYPEPGASVLEKTWYQNGQLSYEGLGFDGNKYQQSKYYYPDGQLKRRVYEKSLSQGVTQFKDSYDQQGKLTTREESYGEDPQLTLTYGPDGQLQERDTLEIAGHRSIKESFDPHGQLTDLQQYRTGEDYAKDGRQIQTYDGQTTYSSWNNGRQQGEEKVVRDGKVIRYQIYRDGKENGPGFSIDDDKHQAVFVSYQAGEISDKIYSVGLDYLSFDSQGMPKVTLPFHADKRELPPAGSVWEYSSNGKQSSVLTLISSDKQTATWRVGDSGFKEHLNSYSQILPEQPATDRQLLNFPLTLGKTWHTQYQFPVHVDRGDGQSWQYIYHASADSRITGVAKITVAAGSFDTVIITRHIRWSKTDPQFSGPQAQEIHCQSKQCSVSGFTFETLWYAPSVGRAVIKAVAINGMSDVWANDDQSILQNPNALISELTWFGKQAAPGEPATGSKYAHELPASAFIRGFPLMMNNTAEFAMIHHPVIE